MVNEIKKGMKGFTTHNKVLAFGTTISIPLTHENMYKKFTETPKFKKIMKNNKNQSLKAMIVTLSEDAWTYVPCDNCTEIAGRFKKDEPNKQWLVTLDLRPHANMIAKSFSVIGQTDTWAVQWIKVNRKCCRT